MPAEAVRRKLGESDDLDGKEYLPVQREGQRLVERVRQGGRRDVQHLRRPPEVAAAHRDLFPRQDTVEATLEQHVHHTTDLVLNESADRPTAKLIVVARLSRPVPRMVPQPPPTAAQLVIEQGSKHACALLDGAVWMPRLLGLQSFPTSCPTSHAKACGAGSTRTSSYQPCPGESANVKDSVA
ncbi:hypothetical protein ACFWBM_00875 [Streptomyces sp. NPDC059980]|uniref:hypothetical protein n=1 Tax=Streptomyces sp. NPDC059980 TaxID=3347022 RepID=UPI003691EBB7